ncbi:SocA family protein [Chryseobacterium gleum]|uniref:SocA family protein n=1 Tax=Chryseobacterium gleum TaxID=250 RepID=UPI001E461749|nr:SocA family protein [Chryseobacterium gleum]MCE4067320.1 SocA family protein [Chryseobacterium gleum]
MKADKLLLTKYILYKFSVWYEESYGNSESNDLSVLKSLKLIFLLATVNSDKPNENLLDIGFKFVAMPYGPVETEIYDSYREKTITDIIDTNGINSSFLKSINYDEVLSHLSGEKKIIDNSLSILKSKNYYLILKSASYLVDLTHMFNSWKQNYKKALILGKYSFDIPNDDIKKDILYYSL